MSDPLNADPQELAKFSQLAHRWWDPDSEFKPLHDINPLRLEWIDRHCPLAGKRVLDVGCGGGILSESMAARGADVFAKSCSTCHGQGALGGRASALADSRRIQSLSNAEVQSIIRNGTSAGMPPFPALTPAELESVTAYVRSLNESADVGHATTGDAAAGEDGVRRR